MMMISIWCVVLVASGWLFVMILGDCSAQNCACASTANCVYCPITGNCVLSNETTLFGFCPGSTFSASNAGTCISSDYIRLSPVGVMSANVTLLSRSSVFALIDLTAPIEGGLMYQVYTASFDGSFIPCYLSREEQFSSVPSATTNQFVCFPSANGDNVVNFAPNDGNFVRDTYVVGVYVAYVPFSFQIGVQVLPNPGSQFAPTADSLRYYILFSVMFTVALALLFLSLRRCSSRRRQRMLTDQAKMQLMQQAPRLHVLWLNNPRHNNEDTIDDKRQPLATEVHPSCFVRYYIVRIPSDKHHNTVNVQLAVHIQQTKPINLWS